MPIADRHGPPVACCVTSASPHESKLVEATVAQRFTRAKPERMIGDRAYDNDPLDQRLRQKHGIRLIAPHKYNLRRSGPAYRRDMMHMAQEVDRFRRTPWLEGDGRFAHRVFRKVSERLVELGNDFLHRLAEMGIPELAQLPEDLGTASGLRARSEFQFNLIERVAAPASPFLFVADLISGALALRKGITRDAREFLDQLLAVNSARVQSDVDERIRESRRQLESEIKHLLREATAIAERALARARTTRAAGAPVVEAALARLEAVECEVRSFRPSELKQPARLDDAETAVVCFKESS